MIIVAGAVLSTPPTSQFGLGSAGGLSKRRPGRYDYNPVTPMWDGSRPDPSTTGKRSMEPADGSPLPVTPGGAYERPLRPPGEALR